MRTPSADSIAELLALHRRLPPQPWDVRYHLPESVQGDDLDDSEGHWEIIDGKGRTIAVIDVKPSSYEHLDLFVTFAIWCANHAPDFSNAVEEAQQAGRSVEQNYEQIKEERDAALGKAEGMAYRLEYLEKKKKTFDRVIQALLKADEDEELPAGLSALADAIRDDNATDVPSRGS